LGLQNLPAPTHRSKNHPIDHRQLDSPTNQCLEHRRSWCIRGTNCPIRRSASIVLRRSCMAPSEVMLHHFAVLLGSGPSTERRILSASANQDNDKMKFVCNYFVCLCATDSINLSTQNTKEQNSTPDIDARSMTQCNYSHNSLVVNRGK
jgi:hypothetical protein